MTADWLDISEYPFQSNYFDINGYKLHYLDEGPGEIVLFVHGTIMLYSWYRGNSYWSF